MGIYIDESMVKKIDLKKTGEVTHFERFPFIENDNEILFENIPNENSGLKISQIIRNIL